MSGGADLSYILPLSDYREAKFTVGASAYDNNRELGVEWLARQGGIDGGRGSAVAGTLGGTSIGAAGFNFRIPALEASFRNASSISGTDWVGFMMWSK